MIGKHDGLKYSLAFLAAAGLVALTSTAGATGWGSGGSTATFDNLIPSMSSGQAYSERYSFAVDLDEGGHIGMNLTISNLGVRNGYGAADVRVRLPDHDNYSSSERLSRRNWSYEEDRFQIDISNTRVRAVDDDTFELKYEGDDLRVELQFKNRIPMWRPGNGELRSDDDFYRFTIVSPRADVTGRVYIDGQWRDVKGSQSGYADHVVTNVAPYNLGNRFSRFRQYDGDVFVMWREIDLTNDFGGGSVTWILVGRGDQILYEDTDATLQFGNIEHDEETGYRFPHAVQITSSNGSDKMRLLVRGDDVRRRDLLAGQGRMVRAIASRVSNPFQYDVRGQYALEVEVGGNRLRRSSEGNMTLDYVGK